jgi:hypothetical protein
MTLQYGLGSDLSGSWGSLSNSSRGFGEASRTGPLAGYQNFRDAVRPTMNKPSSNLDGSLNLNPASMKNIVNNSLAIKSSLGQGLLYKDDETGKLMIGTSKNNSYQISQFN